MDAHRGIEFRIHRSDASRLGGIRRRSFPRSIPTGSKCFVRPALPPPASLAQRQQNLRGFQIDVGLRQFAKQGVGFLFFLQRFVEQRGGVLHAELQRPSFQRP